MIHVHVEVVKNTKNAVALTHNSIIIVNFIINIKTLHNL